ncbi:MAG: hypothetical protein ACQEP1_04305 [Nanobdellota archaeon]
MSNHKRIIQYLRKHHKKHGLHVLIDDLLKMGYGEEEVKRAVNHLTSVGMKNPFAIFFRANFLKVLIFSTIILLPLLFILFSTPDGSSSIDDMAYGLGKAVNELDQERMSSLLVERGIYDSEVEPSKFISFFDGYSGVDFRPLEKKVIEKTHPASDTPVHRFSFKVFSGETYLGRLDLKVIERRNTYLIAGYGDFALSPNINIKDISVSGKRVELIAGNYKRKGKELEYTGAFDEFDHVGIFIGGTHYPASFTAESSNKCNSLLSSCEAGDETSCQLLDSLGMEKGGMVPAFCSKMKDTKVIMSLGAPLPEEDNLAFNLELISGDNVSKARVITKDI